MQELETQIAKEETVIALSNVCCKAGYKYLLKDINWEVKKGDHWVVFGMNGSGKTTLLSIIAAFRHYTSGNVKVFGKPFNNENILETRKKIGWVSASFFDKQFSKESALDIVLSGKCGTLGLNNDITLKDVKLAKALLTELQLGNKIDNTFDMFSKGERQNILIARALISNPDILILDEPCAGLDIYNRSYLFSTIEELSQKKDLTIIYVTHYAEEILPIFDKMLLLRNGHVFAKGFTKELLCDDVMKNFLGHEVTVKQQDNAYHLDVKTQSTLIKLLV